MKATAKIPRGALVNGTLYKDYHISNIHYISIGIKHVDNILLLTLQCLLFSIYVYIGGYILCFQTAYAQHEGITL